MSLIKRIRSSSSSKLEADNVNMRQHWCLALVLLVALVMPTDPLIAALKGPGRSLPALARAVWHECNSQGIYPGLYGSEVLAK